VSTRKAATRSGVPAPVRLVAARAELRVNLRPQRVGLAGQSRLPKLHRLAELEHMFEKMEECPAYVYGRLAAETPTVTHRGGVSRIEGRGALIWGPWRVELINLDGRPILRVKYLQYLVADCRTAREALDLLSRHSIPWTS